MKKLLLLLSIIFLMSGLYSFGQDISPLPNINVKKLIAPNNPIFYYNTADSAMWVFKGETGWLKIASNSQLQKYYVPYAGATKNVNLNTHSIIALGQKLPINIGVITMPDHIKNGDGTITLGNNGLFNFCKSEDGTGEIVTLSVGSTATITLTDGVINYIYANYNNGNPYYEKTLDNTIFRSNGTFAPILRATREGNTVHFEEYDEYATLLANKIMLKDVYINGGQRLSGLILSTNAIRISTISAGSAVFAVQYYPNMAANVAGTSGLMYEYYLISGIWNKVLVTSYDASYYSDGTNRLSLNNNKWVAKYFWRDAGDDNEVYYIHGNQYNTEAEATNELLPIAPNVMTGHSIYVGKIIIQKGETNGIALPRIWEGQVQSIGVSNHYDLSGGSLVWSASGHTGDINKLAAFDGNGTATNTATGNLTETVTGLEFSDIRQVIGGSTTLSITSGYLIPTTASATSWDNKISSNQTITFTASGDVSGTTTGTISLLPTLTLATITQGSGNNFVKISLDSKGRVIGNTTVGSSDITTVLGYIPVTNARTLTINGITQDLSADRTWNVGTVTNVTATTPLSSTGGTSPNITIQQANTSQGGYLSSTDWNTFNDKQSQLNGTGFVKASGTTISYDNSNYLNLNGGTMSNSNLVTNLNANYLNVSQDFGTDYSPNHYLQGKITASSSYAVGLDNWWGGISVNTKGNVWQLYGGGDLIKGNWYFREGLESDNTWSSWYKIWHSGNFNPSNYAPANGSGNYIWNGTDSQSGNFNITGTGMASKFSDGYIDYTLAQINRLIDGKVELQYGFTGANRGVQINGNTANSILLENGTGVFPSTIQATTAKLTNLTNGFVPNQTANELVNSPIWTNGANVGIGTVDPQSKLEVSGNTTIDATGASWGEGLNIDSPDGIWGGIKWRTVGRSGNTGNWHLGYNATHNTEANSNLYLFNGAGNYPMTWTQGGNVGIGYSTGTEINNNKLAVNGSGYFNGPINSTGYLLNGTNLFSSLSSNTIAKWDGTKLVNAIANTDFSSDIHANITALNAVSGTNTGNQVLTIGGTIAPTINLSGSNTATFVASTGLSFTQSGGTITATNTAPFPGFGTNHTTAAYGDHNHSGIYDNYGYWSLGSNDVFKNNILSNAQVNFNAGEGLSTAYTNVGGISKITTSMDIGGLSTIVSPTENYYLPLASSSGSGASQIKITIGILESILGTTTGTASRLIKRDSSADAYAHNFILSSDSTLKKNITPLGNTNWTNKIQFKKFQFKDDPKAKIRYGVIAQDIEKIAPELVSTDDQGKKAVAYIDLLIAKIAEMDKQIKLLQNEVKELKNKVGIITTGSAN